MVGRQTVVVKLEVQFWNEASWIKCLISAAGEVTSLSSGTGLLHLSDGDDCSHFTELLGGFSKVIYVSYISHHVSDTDYNTKPKIHAHVSFKLKTGRHMVSFHFALQGSVPHKQYHP